MSLQIETVEARIREAIANGITMAEARQQLGHHTLQRKW